MGDLIFDLKVFHRSTGKYLIKTFFKIFITALLIYLTLIVLSILFTAIVIMHFPIIFILLSIVVASAISYLAIFFDDRPIIKEVRKEIKMEQEYPSMLNKFNKTF